MTTGTKEGLEGYGLTVLPACSGREGLKLFREHPVDVVVCDLGMPGMNGWEVGKAVREICAKRGTSPVPFVLLTGWGDCSDLKSENVDQVVDAVVQKPVEITALLDIFRDMVGMRGARESWETMDSPV